MQHNLCWHSYIARWEFKVGLDCLTYQKALTVGKLLIILHCFNNSLVTGNVIINCRREVDVKKTEYSYQNNEGHRPNKTPDKVVVNLEPATVTEKK